MDTFNRIFKKKHIKATILSSFLFCSALPSSNALKADEALNSPEALKKSEIKLAKIGNTHFYFYMTPKKQAISHNLVKAVNDKQLLLIADVWYEPCTTTEISALASISPDPLNGVVADPVGNAVLDKYADEVLDIASNYLHLNVQAKSREINLIVSQDAHKFHQDQFKKQYDYLQANHASLPKCQLVHDLTLIDWNMSKETISGTLIQDEGGDRFLIALHPKEAVGIITTEPPIYPEDNLPPTFPGSTSLPFHAVLSPIDKKGDLSCGSAKGQRISTVIRGIVTDENAKELESRATPLFIDRPAHKLDEQGLAFHAYENGMLFKQFPSKKAPKVDISWNHKLADNENVDILKTKPEEHAEVIENIMQMFDISNTPLSQVGVYHLIKKDGGFSALKALKLNIPSSAQIVLVNSSKLPEGYKSYSLSEDMTDKAYPWMHIYNFNPAMALSLNLDQFNRLLLTPMEELIFRDEQTDLWRDERMCLQFKPVTRIDVFVFPKN